MGFVDDFSTFQKKRREKELDLLRQKAAKEKEKRSVRDAITKERTKIQTSRADVTAKRQQAISNVGKGFDAFGNVFAPDGPKPPKRSQQQFQTVKRKKTKKKKQKGKRQGNNFDPFLDSFF